MKINEPISDKEIVFDDDTIIVSKTDLKGIITSCNDAFTAVSGFSSEELIGKNHNIVRHPDMPPVAFKDLWDTINAGHPWTGIVKNRAKNGDFYWVKANVTPVKKDGRVVEYMSVRTRPTQDEIAQADALYRSINAGNYAPNGRIKKFIGALFDVSLMKKFTFLMMVMAFAFLSIVATSWFVMNDAETGWREYQASVAKRQNLISDIKSHFGYGGAIHNFKNYVLRGNQEYADRFTGNITDLLNKLEDYSQLPGINEVEKESLARIRNVANAYQATLGEIRPMVNRGVDARTIDAQVKIEDKPALDGIEKLSAEYERLTQERTDALTSSIDSGRVATIGTPLIAFFVLVVLFWLALKRGIMQPLAIANEQFSRISEGHYFDDFDIKRGDEIGDLLRGLKVMQTRLSFDVKEAEERANEAVRIKTALDNVSSAVMMADNDANIIYMNKTVMSLFRDAQDDIREQLPDFDADDLIGRSIDTFHQDPQHQRRLLEALSDSFTSEIEVGGRTLRIIANPVINESGERLGSAVEWSDRTTEVAVEREVQDIVAAAQLGDLGRRISLDGKEGFFLHLSKQFNDLLDMLSLVFDDVATVMGRLARGDLTRPIEREYQGMFGMVKDDLNESLDNLKDIVCKLRETADTVNTASSEISSGNDNLSARTEQQASSLEETASGMEELTSTVKNNADNAQQANQLAASARQVAEKGGDVVRRAVQAMDAINQSSQRIAEIIGVIDEIAFQTNLLALNASVEAARAGEQGRGFAVVATEVRNLAGRSATAAKEIKELIQDSAEKVNVGAELVNESGATLDEIVSGVKKVGDIISEIAAASQEQSAGIEQLNQAINSMDEVTQQNAALAEETSSASAALREKAEEMESLIGFFRVDGDAQKNDDASGMDFFKARSAHMAWRSRIRDFLDGKLSLTEDEAVSHHHCVLGKWLYSTGLEKYGHFPEMQELEPEHEKLHTIIKEIVRLKGSGNEAEAELRYQDIEALSKNIIRLLKGVERRVD